MLTVRQIWGVPLARVRKSDSPPKSGLSRESDFKPSGGAESATQGLIAITCSAYRVISLFIMHIHPSTHPRCTLWAASSTERVLCSGYLLPFVSGWGTLRAGTILRTTQPAFFLDQICPSSHFSSGISGRTWQSPSSPMRPLAAFCFLR